MRRQGFSSRGLGQNFLVDRHAVNRIVDALAPAAADSILEIGPGSGALTEILLPRAGRMVAVELDRRLAAALRERFPEDRLALIEGDVLRLDLSGVGRLLDAAADSRLAVVGNLPYSISKPVAMKLIRDRELVDRAVLMFQKEVADRLVSPPESRSYGPLSVLASLTFTIEPLFDLKPGAFRPRPKVDSTVTRWSRRTRPAFDRSIEPVLMKMLAASFHSRRRMLRNNLLGTLGSADEVDRLLKDAEIDGRKRAEQLAPEDFVRLAEGWHRTV